MRLRRKLKLQTSNKKEGKITHVRLGPEEQEKACCVGSEGEAVCRAGQPVALWRSEEALAGSATHARLQEMEYIKSKAASRANLYVQTFRPPIGRRGSYVTRPPPIPGRRCDVTKPERPLIRRWFIGMFVGSATNLVKAGFLQARSRKLIKHRSEAPLFTNTSLGGESQ